MDHDVVTVVSHSLPAIAEDRPLDIPKPSRFQSSVNSADNEGDDRSLNDERSPLLPDGYLSRSYADLSVTSQMTGVSSAALSDNEVTSRFESSVMTDYQASLFLPSLQLSMHSAPRRLSDAMMSRRYTQSSMGHTRSLAVSLFEKLSDDRGSSMTLAIWNILPCLLGSGVFSLPFTVAHGGYVIIGAILLLTLLTAITSHLVIDCLYEISPKSKTRKRVRADYLDISRAVLGRRGATVVKYSLLFYFYAVDIVMIVLLGKSAYKILHRWTGSVSLSITTCICAATVLPTLFVTRLSVMAYLSMVAVFATVVGFSSSIGVYFERVNVWSTNAAELSIADLAGLPLALSILLFSFLPQPVVCQIEGSMRDPKRFPKAMGISLVISSLFKVLMALLGALSFGPATNMLVSLNIASDSNIGGLVTTIAICLLAYFGYPLNIFVICDTFDNAFIPRRWPQFQKGGKYNAVWIALTRPFFIAATLGPALALPHFGLLVGVIGSAVATVFAFLLPCLFHLKLKWKTLKVWQVIAEVLVMALGVVMGITGLYASTKKLAKSM